MRRVYVEGHENEIDEKLIENGFTYVGMQYTLSGKTIEVWKYTNGKEYTIKKLQSYSNYEQQYEGKHRWVEYVVLSIVK